MNPVPPLLVPPAVPAVPKAVIPPAVPAAEEPLPAAAPSDPRRPLPNGTVVGEYTVTSELGMGGFGITYRARHNSRGTVVVLKEHMPRGMALREPEGEYITAAAPEHEEPLRATMEEFIEEVTVMTGLQHPGIVPILAAFEANGTAYYVMPYVYGKALELPEHATLDRAERVSEARSVKRLLLALLDTLVYMEQHNVVHRDIKPENIVVTPEGQPVLLDFGSARQLAEGKVYSNIYTPGFCAPEQVGAESDEDMSGRLGAWTDIYALGATFVYLITRMLPPRAEVRLASSPDPYKPLAARPDLCDLYGETFLRALDRAMETEPRNRWQDAAAWRTAIEDGILPTVPRLLRRNRLLAAGAAAAVLVFGGISLWALNARREAMEIYGNSLHFTEGILYDFHRELTDIPGSTSLQQQLGNHLRSYLNRMEQLPVGDDEKLQRALAAAWKNLGSVNMAQGKLEDATRALQRATAMEESLISLHPQEPRYIYELSRTRLLRAEVARRRNMYAEAAELVDAARTALKALCLNNEENPDYACALGRALEHTATLARLDGNNTRRKEALGDMLSLYRRLMTRYSRHEKTRMGLAEALQERSELAVEEREYAAAEKMLEEAHTIWSDLAGGSPNRMSFKKGLAMVYYTRGNLYARMSTAAAAEARKDGWDAKALKEYSHHLDLARELESLDPYNAEYPYLQCRTYMYMVDTLLRVGQPNLAVAYCNIVLQKGSKLRETAPDNAEYALLYAGALRGLALAHGTSPEHYTKAAKEMAEYRTDIAARLQAKPDNLTLLYAYLDSLAESAELAYRMGKHKQAEAWLQEAYERAEKEQPDSHDFDDLRNHIRKLRQQHAAGAQAAP